MKRLFVVTKKSKERSIGEPPFTLKKTRPKQLVLKTSYVDPKSIENEHTVPIDRILSVKNARTWVSMDFT